MYLKSGSYYYVSQANKWIGLGKDLSAAKLKWAELENGYGAPLLMKDVIQRYLNEVAINKAPSTYAGNKLEAKNLTDVFGMMPPEDVMPEDIYAFMVARGKTSQVRANRERSLLSGIMGYACVWGHRKDNPVREVKPFREDPRTRYITDDEFLAVRAIAPTLVQAMMDLALLTAQRSQDLLALRRNADAEAGLVILQKKTIRTKPVKLLIEWSPELRTAIDTLKALKRPFTSLFLVTSQDGNQITESGWKTAWQRTMNKAMEEGVIADRFHFHDIRAKTITDLEMSGRNAQDISGHATREMIEKVYKRLGTTKVAPLR